jgi:hypothetical protein
MIGQNLNNGRVFPAHDFKAFRESGGIVPFILKLGARWRRMVNITYRPLYRRETTTFPVAEKAGWAAEANWNFRRREKSLALATIGNPDLGVGSLDYAIPDP